MRLSTFLPLSISLFSLVEAQFPGIPQGGGVCKTNWDCSLGGECSSINNTCVCDAWTTGPTCNLLNLQRGQGNTSIGTGGLQVPNYHSWGGHALLNTTSNEYNLFSSFMCNHATLSEWTTASSIWRSTSPTPDGPFVLQELISQPWAHNAMISQLPSTMGGGYVLFQIGDSVVDPSQWEPCYNSSEAEEEEEVSHLVMSTTTTTTTSSSSTKKKTYNNNNPVHEKAVGGYAFYARSAPTMEGPWSPLVELSIDYSNAPFITASSGNPAPYFMANGTTLLYFSAYPCPPNWNQSNSGNTCISVARSDTGWQGPYKVIPSLPITAPESEDPFVFTDTRGNYHLLTNVNNDHTRCAAGVACVGHAWSTDGLQFSPLTIGAAGPVITLEDGTIWSNAYIERPQILQADDGTPITFYVGIGRTSYLDSATWAQNFCTPTATNCGPTVPPPPPPPSRVQYRDSSSGLCISTNSSAVYPCPGGWGNSCPIFLDSCSSVSSYWLEHNDGSGLIENYNVAGACINIDCNSCGAHTIGKIIHCDSATAVKFTNTTGSSTGQLTVTGICESSMCLNKGEGPATAPCKAGEEYLPNAQLQLEACGSANTVGWTRIVVPS